MSTCPDCGYGTVGLPGCRRIICDKDLGNRYCDACKWICRNDFHFMRINLIPLQGGGKFGQ